MEIVNTYKSISINCKNKQDLVSKDFLYIFLV